MMSTEYDAESFLDEYSPLCDPKVTPRRKKIEEREKIKKYCKSNRMEIMCTEYDTESFLDEYSPLCDPKITPRRTKIEQFRRRCLNEIPLTNNPLSKFRHNASKKNDRKQQQNPKDCYDQQRILKSVKTISDSSIPENDRRSERGDSGYFSIDPDERVYFISGDGNKKWNDDLEPTVMDDMGAWEHEKTEKASSFVKKRSKFLMYKHNLKLSMNKNKEKTSKGQSELDSNKEKNSEKSTSRTKKLSWKRAKKQASVVVRFIKRDTNNINKNDDLAELIEEDSLISVNPKDNYTHDAVTKNHEKNTLDNIEPIPSTSIHPSETNTAIQKTEAITKADSQQNDQYLTPFDDSFLPYSNNSSPIMHEYLVPTKNFARCRPVRRGASRPLYRHSTADVTFASPDSHEDDLNNSKHFIEKYLNRSKSLGDIKFNDQYEQDLESSIDPFDDFEPDSTIVCSSPDEILECDDIINNSVNEETLSKPSRPIYFETINEEVEEMVNNREYLEYQCHNKKLDNELIPHEIKKEFHSSHPNFESIVEEEVDNYILNDQDDSLNNIKHTKSLSYSVNDLYDLMNRDGIFSFEYGFDGLMV